MTRLALALALLVTTCLGAQERQVFKVSVDGVVVDVLVLDAKRRAVSGLAAGDFELRDSGVVQTIESVSFEDVPLRIMLVLDTSASVRGMPLTHLKDAVRSVIDGLHPGDEAALMTFSGTIALRSDWTADRKALHRAIDEATAGGATTLHDVAEAALLLRSPTPGRAVVLMFSDGADTASWLPGEHVIELAQRTDAVVYVVTLARQGRREPGYRADFTSGLQPRLDNVSAPVFMERFVDRLADESGGAVLQADDSAALRSTFEQLMLEFRSRYLLTYTPAGVEATGWHPIEVKLTHGAGRVVARRGYLR